MVHNKGDGRKPPGWGIPGGGVQPRESLVDAAAREVFEEAGITILPEELIEIDRSLAKGSTTHINVSFQGPDYDRAMGEITIENDPGKSVDAVELVPCEDIMEAFASYRNGASPVDSQGRRYYTNHLDVVCD